MAMKVLKPMGKGVVSCKCISLYPSRLECMLYSSIEKEEYPKLFVKRVWNDRLKTYEIEVVFLGNYHLEKPSYFRKPKKDWVSFGAFVLSPQQAWKLGELLIKLTGDKDGYKN
jgi:hypothetical protein